MEYVNEILNGGDGPELNDWDSGKLEAYAQEITDAIVPLKEEAKRVARAREVLWEKESEELRNRPKTAEEKALDQVVGAVEGNGND